MLHLKWSICLARFAQKLCCLSIDSRADFKRKITMYSFHHECQILQSNTCLGAHKQRRSRFNPVPAHKKALVVNGNFVQARAMKHDKHLVVQGTCLTTLIFQLQPLSTAFQSVFCFFFLSSKPPKLEGKTCA